jgi:hypothetical protein
LIDPKSPVPIYFIRASSTSSHLLKLAVISHTTNHSVRANSHHFGHRNTTTSKTLAKAGILAIFDIINDLNDLKIITRRRIVDAVRSVSAVVVTLHAPELEWPRLNELRRILANPAVHANRQLEL